MRGPYGEEFYVGIRRFVVVANDEGHSNCVPILTYGGKGCRKNGVKARTHGIIYTSRKPHMVPGEPSLGFKEVKARLIDGETLSRESRINYAKICTVEHNVKVLLIGNVVKDDVRIISNAVDDCWQQKKQLQYQYGY
ncbi:hypothetical protein CSOJ01_04642 [Colletotrichum sojae]|uniref:DUF6590 domain-containing protein n=1 Tax=Colletotrichum sojae TaxID=2175907 RepID=A0A8H6JIX9_9PEZI|nr:hypothetical protein CSOJ01_04642 [Colletotrichum sojae]